MARPSGTLMIFRGWAVAEEGQTQEGLAAVRAGIERLRTSGQRLHLEFHLGLLADAHAQAGDVAEALAVLADAEGAAPGEDVWRADTLRRRAELLARAGADTATVEALFHSALTVARGQGAKAYELRAGTRYGRFLYAHGRVARFDDLRTLKVGVQTGTTGDEAISRLQGKNSTDIKRFESTPLALKELETGGIDAVVADNGVVVNYVKNNSGNKFKTVNDAAFVPEKYGIAVKKGNAELLAKLNQGLAAIRADGTYDRIHATYLGTPETAASAPAK